MKARTSKNFGFVVVVVVATWSGRSCRWATPGGLLLLVLVLGTVPVAHVAPAECFHFLQSLNRCSECPNSASRELATGRKELGTDHLLPLWSIYICFGVGDLTRNRWRCSRAARPSKRCRTCCRCSSRSSHSQPDPRLERW